MAELRIEDLPPVDSDECNIYKFAYTFNGYEYWGSLGRCGAIANKIAEKYYKNGDLPDSIIEMRTALFFEVRRERFVVFGMPGIPSSLMEDLYKKIRKIVIEKESR